MTVFHHHQHWVVILSGAESKDLVTSKKISRFTRNDYCLIVTEISDSGFRQQLLHCGDHFVNLRNDMKLNIDSTYDTKSMKMKNEKIIDEIRSLNCQLKEILPDSVNEFSISSKAKIPFKVSILKGVLAHRILELSDPAIELLVNSKQLQAIVLIRAIQETAATLYWLSQKIGEVGKNEKIEGFDNFVMKQLFGGRIKSAKEEAFNVLKAIDKVDQKVEGFRESYEFLCEFTHPNCAGTYLAFGQLDTKDGIFYFGSSSKDNPISSGVNSLRGGLLLTLLSFKERDTNFNKFI